jgi:hypothetical protein
MTYRANPVLEKLDRAAERSGVPALGRWANRALPVPFRIAPAALIAAALLLLLMHRPWSVSLAVTLWSFTLCLHAFGPLRTPPNGRRDERERQMMRDGHFVGLAVTMGVAVAGCFLFGFSAVFAILGWGRIWVPEGAIDWMLLAFFLMILEGNVALMAASWMMPRRRVRDEDESED